MTAEQALAWEEVVEECQMSGLSLVGQTHVLERYAVAKASWRECVAAIEQEGQIVDHHTENGIEKRRNPRMVDYNAIARLLQQLSAALGLTAALNKAGAGGSTTTAEKSEPQDAGQREPVSDNERPCIYKLPMPGKKNA